MVHVLYAEDEVNLREPWVSTFIHRFGFRVDAVTSGKELVSMFHRYLGRYGLVVTDYHMGEGMVGVQAARQILATSPNVPIIVMSAADVHEEVVQVGAHFLPKGLDTLPSLEVLLKKLDIRTK